MDNKARQERVLAALETARQVGNTLLEQNLLAELERLRAEQDADLS